MTGSDRRNYDVHLPRVTATSLNLPIDLDILQLLFKAFFVQSGTTAVTSISTNALTSTRSATCTNVMAG